MKPRVKRPPEEPKIEKPKADKRSAHDLQDTGESVNPEPHTHIKTSLLLKLCINIVLTHKYLK